MTRRILVASHAWAGALAFLFLFAVAATGTALAFVDRFFLWEFGAILQPISDAPPLPLPAILDAAARSLPEGTLIAGGYAPGSRLEAVEVMLLFGMPPAATDPLDLRLYAFDPGTATYLGDFNLEAAWSHKLIHLHSELLAGELGGIVTGVLGLALIAFAASGLIVWWPGRRGLRRKMFRRPWGPGTPGAFRLHGGIGLWLAPVVMLWGLSGVWWSHPGWFGGSMANAGDQADAAIFQDSCGDPITIDQAYRATGDMDGRALSEFLSPPFREGTHVFAFKGAGDMDRMFGDVRVFVDADCAAIVQRVMPGEMAPGTRAGSFLTSLHSGRIFGPFRGLVVPLFGLLLMTMSAVGLVLWWRRHVPILSPRQQRA